jgi:phosphohistidine phosphatase
MRLYLIRHASAAAAEKFSGPDEDRPLTERARAELRAVLPQVAEDEAPPKVIWTSPLVRAVQTAEAVLQLWAPGATVRVTRALLSGADPREVIAEIDREPPGSPLALVGHEPHLGDLLGTLVGGDSSIPMPKAGVARVRYRADARPAGEFRVLYSPGQAPLTDLG